jgi:hypothetical protein
MNWRRACSRFEIQDSLRSRDVCLAPIVLKNSVFVFAEVVWAAADREIDPRRSAVPGLSGRNGDQLCELPEVLGGGGEQELGSSASWSAQPEPIQP